ncbi:hypothetical protein COW36_10250 [bacterium (Candidatus Blackallbacteria) CG17_big_fil_post_rev_8_21_14_2_50_48_46]|uniref:NRDE family protein n=1 Tax=bacterium (Candidatus Blackallbacteria) CG17_big_fil_post_rev_8_21_14_2_50_48_46 TaxID=2014261 RepID=A0A2M7G513_9BACT|nr:MAG: hypothetical protein COW64_20020 [bacterium (Candidatus Blackallbacteria) CG18_big_fil_WC_8_21_14_2_50_49_26]PIW17014.1 MAG: hypothetical protein COW36_10250 [bacterium (Candidatus Blackallbacteria) CG17_big_fil_post_rev_8_21_14_2_50_48_46]PIW48178.1 MAG: hypothetical protein COW20_10425 [bacterium (Candidatus Blackallbacteria) CG13_big_fil_rev_8_21_14_2_50_49_14]
MCLIVWAWKIRPETPLILLANRDEFKQRATAALHAWPTQPLIYGGKDLVQGGTWLGITENGRWAAVTNYREAKAETAPLSRGWLIRDYLLSKHSPEHFLNALNPNDYGGFNLLLGTQDQAYWFSNRSKTAAQALQAGIYGLSNHLLDTPWPKLVKARTEFSALVEKSSNFSAEKGFALMRSEDTWPDPDLPETGVGLPLERQLSPIFIQQPHYGTRSTTLLRWHAAGEIEIQERSYLETGFQDQQFAFYLNPRTEQSPEF